MFHLSDQPFEGSWHFLGLGYHGDEHVWQGVIHLHFHYLRVDHNKAKVLRTGVVKERGNNGIDTNGLTRPSRTGDQHMRHLSQIHDHRLTCHILPQDDGNLSASIVPSFRLNDVAHTDRLRNLVGHLDANGSFPRNRGKNPHGHSFEAECYILIKIDDLFHPNTRSRGDFVARDDRASVNLARNNFNPELFERAHKGVHRARMIFGGGSDAVGRFR